LELSHPTSLLSLARKLWSNRYDLAVNVLPAFRNLLFTYVAGSRHVAGFLDFYTGNRFFSMPHTIRASWTDDTRRYQPGQSLVGKQAEVLSLLFSTSEAILQEFRKAPLLQGPKAKEICLSFLSLDPLKTMPQGLLEDIVVFLESRWPNHRIYSLLTEAEARLIEADAFVRSHVELRPVGSLDSSIATIATASLFVGVDSSQIHMAQMTDTPVIGVFSFTPASLALFRTSDVLGVEGSRSATGDPASGAWPALDAEFEEQLISALGSNGKAREKLTDR